MDTIVIGGGPAGLTAAILIKRGDPQRNVVVLEGHRQLGGRAATDNRNGHLVNQGPHALYLGGAATEVLRRIGIDPAGGPAPTRGAFARYRGRSEVLPTGVSSLLRSSMLSPGEKVSLGRTLAGLARIDSTTFAGVSAAEWIDSVASSTTARELLGALVRLSTYSADLESLSAQVAVSQLQLSGKGVRYLDRGWSTMVDALAQCAATLGVVVETGSPVRHAEPDRGRWVVHTDDAEIGADAVVLAGLSPHTAARLSGSEALHDFASRAEVVTAACLDVGLVAAPRPERAFMLGIDEPTYFSLHSRAADLGSGDVLHALRYGGPPDDGDDVRTDLERIVEEMQPGWRSAAETTRFLPRAVVIHALATAAAGGYAGRPDVVVQDAPGVYLAGDWVGARGHLLDASMASATAAAQALAESGIGVG
ncbi:MAG: FAD-dependent oxidoreductase [Microthrixaceae bacterium]|nr:FAD-dependent oxidoreductase [Microthrixaceae bacterium]